MQLLWEDFEDSVFNCQIRISISITTYLPRLLNVDCSFYFCQNVMLKKLNTLLLFKICDIISSQITWTLLGDRILCNVYTLDGLRNRIAPKFRWWWFQLSGCHWRAIFLILSVVVAWFAQFHWWAHHDRRWSHWKQNKN